MTLHRLAALNATLKSANITNGGATATLANNKVALLRRLIGAL